MVATDRFSSSEILLLPHVPLLAELTRSELEQVAPQLRRHRYRSAEVIYHAGDVAGGLFILLCGRVKMSVGDLAEKRLTTQFIPEGSIFGLHSLLDGGPRLTDAIATKPSQVAIWDREPFLDYLWSNPAMAKAALARMASQYRSAMTRYYDMALLNVPCRVAKALLRYAEPAPALGKNPRAGLGLIELSAVVGATRQSVSKVLAFFEHEGWIVSGRGSIELTDQQELGKFQLSNN